MYKSTKTYGHNLGLSACFRQHNASSHCSQLHGYALSFKLTFSARELDENGWVQDFGGLKPIKQWIEDIFDHKTLVAEDDPEFEMFQQMFSAGVIEMVIVPRTGCEAFAKLVYDHVKQWLVREHYHRTNDAHSQTRVRLESVEVAEHGANSAIYFGHEI